MSRPFIKIYLDEIEQKQKRVHSYPTSKPIIAINISDKKAYEFPSFNQCSIFTKINSGQIQSICEGLTENPKRKIYKYSKTATDDDEKKWIFMYKSTAETKSMKEEPTD